MAGSGRVGDLAIGLVQRKEGLMMNLEFLTCAETPVLLPELRTREEYQAVDSSVSCFRYIGFEVGSVP